MIVDDKPTFDGWFFHNEFDEKNVSVFYDKKSYIDNLLKNTILPCNVSLQPLEIEKIKEEIKTEIEDVEDYKPVIKTLNGIL